MTIPQERTKRVHREIKTKQRKQDDVTYTALQQSQGRRRHVLKRSHASASIFRSSHILCRRFGWNMFSRRSICCMIRSTLSRFHQTAVHLTRVNSLGYLTRIEKNVDICKFNLWVSPNHGAAFYPRTSDSLLVFYARLLPMQAKANIGILLRVRLFCSLCPTVRALEESCHRDDTFAGVKEAHG